MIDRPFASIIIPCRNEERHIASCLDAVLAFDWPKGKLEILLVDGMSTDKTAAIISEYAGKHPFIKLLTNPAMIAPPAMNIGIKAAKGEIIVRLDAHSEYPADYLSRCIDLLQSTNAANAGGRFINIKNGDSVWAEAVQFVTGHKFGVGNGVFRTGAKPGFVDTVPFGTFHRDIFDKVGYFDERLTRNQDNEFNERLIRAGYKIAFDPEIKIYYKNQATLGGLLKQAFSTAAWNVYTLKLFPYTFRWRRFIPAVFTLYLVSIMCIAPWLDGFVWLYTVPGAIYAVACVIISFSAGLNIETRLAIFITFPAYHLIYGAGTLFGILDLVSGHWRRKLGQPLKR